MQSAAEQHSQISKVTEIPKAWRGPFTCHSSYILLCTATGRDHFPAQQGTAENTALAMYQWTRSLTISHCDACSAAVAPRPQQLRVTRPAMETFVRHGTGQSHVTATPKAKDSNCYSSQRLAGPTVQLGRELQMAGCLHHGSSDGTKSSCVAGLRAVFFLY